MQYRWEYFKSLNIDLGRVSEARCADFALENIASPFSLIRRGRRYDDCACEATIVVWAEFSELVFYIILCLFYILIKTFPKQNSELYIISSLLRSHLRHAFSEYSE